MTRAKSIQQYCLGCTGDSAKEVTLCVIPDCPLYPYRFGNSPGSNAYKDRMKLAKARYPDEWAEIMPFFQLSSSKKAQGAEDVS